MRRIDDRTIICSRGDGNLNQIFSSKDVCPWPSTTLLERLRWGLITRNLVSNTLSKSQRIEFDLIRNSKTQDEDDAGTD